MKVVTAGSPSVVVSKYRILRTNKISFLFPPMTVQNCKTFLKVMTSDCKKNEYIVTTLTSVFSFSCQTIQA